MPDMGTETIIEQIREFLGQFVSDTSIDPDCDLFASGMVNSLFAMQLVVYVENEFSIQIAPEDLDYNNFKSLNAIVSFIENKKDSSA
jgi:acyl carrier protein